MATYERTELHTTRVEFHVPAPPPWGATWVEVAKAVSAARAELEAAEDSVHDDSISVAPGEDSVIVSYERRHRTRVANIAGAAVTT